MDSLWIWLIYPLVMTNIIYGLSMDNLWIRLKYPLVITNVSIEAMAQSKSSVFPVTAW